MISRKSTRLIAEAYTLVFSTHEVRRRGVSTRFFQQFIIRNDELHDFLYDEEYPDWLLHFLNVKDNPTSERILKDRIMGLHTGEAFNLFKNPYTDMKPEERRTAGQHWLGLLAQSVFRLSERLEQTKEAAQLLDVMKSQLELDGYVYRNGKLYESETSVMDDQAEHSYLESLVNNLNLHNTQVIKHHLKLSEEHYVNGKWGDSISNSRNFLEAVLQQTAAVLNKKKYAADLPSNIYEKPFAVRDYLEREHLIETKEKEAIAKVYGLLSDTGSHPNIAEKDQARLMWHLALTFSQFVLLRYQGFLVNNP